MSARPYVVQERESDDVHLMYAQQNVALVAMLHQARAVAIGAGHDLGSEMESDSSWAVVRLCEEAHQRIALVMLELSGGPAKEAARRKSEGAR